MDLAAAPIVVFAPFVSSTMRIEPAWIDFNGHLNMAYYLVLFDRAVDEAMAVIGLGPDYVTRRGLSYFTVETHTLYRRELTLDRAVRATAQLVGHDEKRIHLYLELRDAAEGWVAATCEQLFVHVGMADRRACVFPDDVQANLAAMAAAHRRLPRPEVLGRSIALRHRRKKAAAPSRGVAATRH